MKTDTIAAIATALSHSGIGIIRISGEEAIAVADRIFYPKNHKKLSESDSHTIHFGIIKYEGQVIDEVLVLLMKGPHSYTREDTVEIDCHGGVLVMQKILSVVCKAGARLAEPGEFTKRAFLNGRIDLSQAESVIDLINSKNEFAYQSSIKQLQGSVRDKICSLRERILHETAFIEAALDDPEHYSLDGYSTSLEQIVDGLKEEIGHLIPTADQGKILKEGIGTVIVGKPNVGKSSILNILVGSDRAIVTEVAGTTRDVLEEHISLQGISLNVVDTAGIHDTEDIVEKIGVEKAKQYLKDADLVLYVVDSSRELDEEDEEIAAMIKDKKVIVLLNKSDLQPVLEEKQFGHLSSHVLSVSAKEQEGVDQLFSTIQELFFHGEVSFNDEVVITNIRHKNALADALESLEHVSKSILDGMPEDFYSIDLLDAYAYLGLIIGEAVEDDLANEIFSKFCMGK